MLTATRVKIDVTLNEARSLHTYLDLLRKAMSDTNSDLYHLLNEELSSADWQGAAACRQATEDAITAAR